MTPVKKKAAAVAAAAMLSLAEGLAVGALVHSGVSLVCAHKDPLQGAVVCVVAVVGAGLYGAFDALVCVFVHGRFLLLFGFAFSMAPRIGNMMEKIAFLRKTRPFFGAAD